MNDEDPRYANVKGHYDRGYRAGIEAAASLLDRVVIAEIAGLSGLTLTGKERDEWIAMTTARKILTRGAMCIRALSPPDASADTGGCGVTTTPFSSIPGHGLPAPRPVKVEVKKCSKCRGTGFRPDFDGDGPMECRACVGTGRMAT